ncbi:MAG: DivIVA domain-containing protein [Actinobacteria bacterium]|nr:DivIVA domain-containing protein [Actinomycetota bacterium]
MDLTARDINEKQFHDAWRGYNQAEVDDFLDKVAEALDTALRERDTFRRRAGELEQAVATSRDTEEMLKKTLLTAQQAAEEAISKAKAKAEQLVTEAEERANVANEEARQRLLTIEEEMRQKNADAERRHAAKKHEYEVAIEKLRSVESEIEQRLRAFLEQQMAALEQLVAAEVPSGAKERSKGVGPPETPGDARRSAGPASEQRPRARPAGPNTEPVPVVDADAAAQRRGVRGLFSRDEA